MTQLPIRLWKRGNKRNNYLKRCLFTHDKIISGFVETSVCFHYLVTYCHPLLQMKTTQLQPQTIVIILHKNSLVRHPISDQRDAEICTSGKNTATYYELKVRYLNSFMEPLTILANSLQFHFSGSNVVSFVLVGLTAQFAFTIAAKSLTGVFGRITP